MIRNYNQYIQKRNLVQSITEEIRYYEQYSNNLYNQIQSRFIHGGITINNKLEKCIKYRFKIN